MPLAARLQAIRWACGSVAAISGLAFLIFMVVLQGGAAPLGPIGGIVIASLVLLHITVHVSLRLLLRWRDPSPEDRKRIRSLTFWGGSFGYILVVWTLADAEATSPFFKDPNRWA